MEARGSAPSTALSPWQVVLGDRFTELDPRLRAYFQAIPQGSVGVGEGVFDTVGTPRRWVRLIIRVAADPDVLFPVWERDVPFSVMNMPARITRGPSVVAERTFNLRHGISIMRDQILSTPDGIVDILGGRRRFQALFVATVVDGGLSLASTRLAVRIGHRHFIIPRMFAPRVTLTERISYVDERQHVALNMRVPLVGKVYEYSGSFNYEIRSEKA